jgi:S-adenosylmethionine-dependent methyltransferase
MGQIERFYDRNAEREWGRADQHRIEFAVTMRALHAHLPAAPARVVDIGGGPGRYAIALAQRGYAVTLLDISQNCLDLARQKAAEAQVELAACLQGTALDLEQLPAGHFDAALLMGPLYHLLTLDERQLAVRQAHRLLRAGGLIFASFINRYAAVIWAAKESPAWIVEHRDELEEILTTGVNHGGSEESGFTDAYFARPAEIAPLMEGAGFHTLEILSCEGVVNPLEDRLNALSGPVWEAWVALNYRLGKDPAVWGASGHLLYVGRK